MNDTNLELYQQRVNDLGQALLDVIASVSLGDLTVKVDIPEDIEVFADLAVGIEFMVEDLREMAKDQARARVELEQRINERTRELEATLNNLQKAQSQVITDGWEDYSSSSETLAALTLADDQELQSDDVWLPSMSRAVEQSKPAIETNGNNEQSLALPIQLQDQVIGVLGFNRPNDQPWSEREIATVEAIVEQVGLALENQRLFDRTQGALAEADTLYQASAELNTAQEYLEIVKVVQKYTALGKDSQSIYVAVFDRPWSDTHPPEQLQILAQFPQIAPESTRQYQIDASNYFYREALSPSRITFIENFETDPRLDMELRAEFIENLGAKSGAFIPMVVGGQWIGFINCLYAAPAHFTEDDIRRANAIGTQASVAVQNLRSIELAEQRALEAHQRSEELALINRVVSSVAAAVDLPESLRIVSDELNRAINLDETGIALFGENQETLTVTAFVTKDPAATTLVGQNIPVEGNLAILQVINSRQPLIITQAQTSPQTSIMRELMIERNYQTQILLPLMSGMDVIGVIGMGLQSVDAKISQDEMRLAETIVIQASTAIQNARLLDQTQAALTETANLYQANKELNAVQSFQDVLGVLQRHTILGRDPKYLTLFLFDQPWLSDFTPKSFTPIAQWADLNVTPIEEGSTPLSQWPNFTELMKLDSLTLVQDLAIDPRIGGRFRQVFLDEQKAKMLLLAPLVSGNRWIGHIIATYPTQIDIQDDEQRRLLALAGQAAIAIENLGLLEETARRANQLETAADVARQASSTLDTDALLNRAVNLIRDRFGYYHASIFLLEDEYAVVRASTGEAGRQLVETNHKLPLEKGTSIIGHVCETGEPLVVPDVTLDPTHRPHPLLPDTRAELGLPLKIGGRVTGAMDVQSTHANAFTDDDIAVLQTLSDQIAIALDNAHSFEVAQQAVEEMREIDRLKSEFLANMSHELRTPLNSIIGFSRVILKGIDGPINDIQTQDLQAIHSSGQHLLDMINNILDLSKIEAGKMELSIEEIELETIIDGVVSTARGLIKEKPIKLISNVPENLPIVSADRTRVRQIMLNLLQNAAKFTEEGQITVNLEHIDEPDNPHVKISVSDSGIGIDPDDQEQLFERFSQVDSSLTRKVGGTGLGLSITKHLVEMQGGTIDLDSQSTQGSTFYFTLPVVRPLEIEEPDQDEQIDPDLKLIVSIDDDPKVIALYKRYLASHGYQVLALTDPTTALEKIKQIQPHAITLDIMMPSKDGWQVIQDIKNDPATKAIPVVICSIVDDQEKAYRLGAIDYLVKPILEKELVKAVKSITFSQDRTIHDILIIDDDPNVHQLIQIALRNEPTFRLQYANGGSQGLEMIHQRKPEAVILDLIMPDIDGFSILETMQENPEIKSIPVIILTAAELSHEERTKLNEFKNNVLKKDVFKGEELIQLLETALDKIPIPEDKE